MGTIFIAGSYGVGKSTLCDNLSRVSGVPAYSAGDLISCINGEQYGANKVVQDKEAKHFFYPSNLSMWRRYYKGEKNLNTVSDWQRKTFHIYTFIAQLRQ